AIWTAHPLSIYARVETTFIEGDVYFDRKTDLANREALRREKEERLKREDDEKKKKAAADKKEPKK
ncbi:MAG TPA: hypothetical protein VF111_04900, partial [Thermoanaerobaculia bacterium]